ncbi:hypothetical protein JTB14_002561 [Gonioctena quinquepunctata]|nr:hypothetical protein JTB14_002561 [Gonioctena quinquepunctata]
MNRKTSPKTPVDNSRTETFLDKVAPATVEKDLTHIHISQHQNENNHLIFKQPVMLDDLISPLKQTNVSAPGYDNIQNCMLENLPNFAKEKLLKIINELWINGKQIKA